jgi:NMD protein affecting ribosome stability and mRNA decay
MSGENICPKCGKPKRSFELVCLECNVERIKRNRQIFLGLQNEQVQGVDRKFNEKRGN